MLIDRHTVYSIEIQSQPVMNILHFNTSSACHVQWQPLLCITEGQLERSYMWDFCLLMSATSSTLLTSVAYFHFTFFVVVVVAEFRLQMNLLVRHYKGTS